MTEKNPRLRALDLPVLAVNLPIVSTSKSISINEAGSIIPLRTALADIPELWITDVVSQCSSDKVLAMELSARERVALFTKRHPETMPQAIQTLVRLTLQTIFEERLGYES